MIGRSGCLMDSSKIRLRFCLFDDVRFAARIAGAGAPVKLQLPPEN